MSRTLDVRRSLAATAALVLAAVGTAALPAAAEPGNGNGQGNGKGSSQSQKSNPGKSHQSGQKEKGGQKEKSGKGPQGPQKPGKGSNSQGNQGNQGSSSAGQGSQGEGNASGDPAGNNGTVKITPIGQDDGIPQNNPHVPCGFDIEWYGFDEGDDIISKVTLTMQAPTGDVVPTPGGPSVVFVGGDPATGAGTDTGLDGEATYYPMFDGEPHPQQGYHVKLTINTPDSQGADTKHKVFWVEPCESATPPEAGEEDEGGRSSDTEVLGEQATADDDTEVLGEQATADDDTEVMGAQASASAEANVPNAVDAGEAGNPVLDLSGSPLPLLLVGLGALLAGAAFRRRTSS